MLNIRMMNIFLNVQQQLTLSVQYIANLKIVLPFFLNELHLCEFAKATLIAHAYRSALGERDVKRISWLQSFFVCIFLSSSGTCTVAILRGEPFGIINKDEIWLIYGFTCWVMFSNPYLFKTLAYVFMTFPMSKAFFIGLSGLRRGYSLVQYGVDGVIIKPECKKIVARVLCGTLAGSGGGLWNGTCIKKERKKKRRKLNNNYLHDLSRLSRNAWATSSSVETINTNQVFKPVYRCKNIILEYACVYHVDNTACKQRRCASAWCSVICYFTCLL
ncbi:MAG: hypothetical protein EXX96DRAFT_546932 [Benjaminiella poitrasii]|nr:MAG: hypothetical protein EXX96DRAFT_546932 [Benjaminiella poitrasii]